MRLNCIKCGHSNPLATSADDSCPKCGAIYSKARPTAARPVEDGLGSGFSATSTLGGAPGAMGDYVKRLRAGSQYPAFRAVAGAAAFFGYIVAALIVIGGAVAWWKGGWGVGLGSIVVGFLIAVLSKALKEASLMLADLSDATLRMARRQESERL